MSYPKYTDIITRASLLDVSLESLPRALRDALRADDPQDTDLELLEGVDKIISYWTGRIEEHLGRHLILRPCERFDFEPYHWRKRDRFTIPGTNSIIGAYSPEWPIVEVCSVNNDVSLAEFITVYGRESRFFTYDSLEGAFECPPTFIEAYWGYRRDDQEPPSSAGSGSGSGEGSGGSGSTDWDTAMGTGDDTLSGLGVNAFVPTLPADIVLACTRLSVAEIRAQSRAIVGVTEATFRADKLQTTSTKVPSDFIESELRALYHHKRGL